jgi:hypothetical protein
MSQLAAVAGWFHVRDTSSLDQHPVNVQIGNALLRLSVLERSLFADEAVDAAVRLGMSQPPSSLDQLIRWGEQAGGIGIELPDRWLTTMNLWRSWEISTHTSRTGKPKVHFGRKTEVSRVGIRI